MSLRRMSTQPFDARLAQVLIHASILKSELDLLDVLNQALADALTTLTPAGARASGGAGIGLADASATEVVMSTQPISAI
jgi:hypothetical protein